MESDISIHRASEVVKASLVTLVFLFAAISFETSAVDPQTILECLPREYTFRAFKPYRLKGKVLPCYDDVTVYSCWGRCDSYEYGDYKIPFKISHHPVCTYTDLSSRQVRLRRCHPDHPDPFYEVFDATECSCSVCNADNTSCENLNG